MIRRAILKLRARGRNTFAHGDALEVALEAVLAAKLPKKDLDDKVERVLRQLVKEGAIVRPKPKHYEFRT